MLNKRPIKTGKKDYLIMKKVTLKDSKGNEINDIMKDVLTFDCETTGFPPKGAKWDVDFAEFPNIVQLAWAVNEKEGMCKTDIAKQLGISRNLLYSYLYRKE